MTAAAAADTISPRLIESVCHRLSNNERVRRALPHGGRIHIDRQLPFLSLYRFPGELDEGVRRLVTSEASYLFASAARSQRDALATLVREVVRTLGSEFGAFLLLELWSADVDRERETSTRAEAQPAFRLIAPRSADIDPFVDRWADVFGRLRVNNRPAKLDIVRKDRIAPPHLAPVLAREDAAALQCTVLGLVVEPIYRDLKTHAEFPLVLRELERSFTRALRRLFYTFARTRTTQRPRHYHGLGRRAVVQAVWEVDRRLAEISNGFDFLLQVTPYNVRQSWTRFTTNRYEKAPVFRYRPLPIDPVLVKRQLFAIPLERIEDPTLHDLFREKQDELDRRLTMLLDINTPRFVHGSAQLYGGVDGNLATLATELLSRISPRSRADSAGGLLPVEEFVTRAEAEIDSYRSTYPEMNSGVQLREDITGMMVSRGRLLVNRYMRIPVSRADALIQHEVGTHIVTYYNGRAQPLRQLYSGLAGYDALQEGIAVFAEYMVDGLSGPRIRLLAARVLAVGSLLDGAEFVDTFRLLNGDHGFDRRTAFNVALRVHRGGGLTKDAVYLSGLIQLLDHLQKAGSLEPLLVGKIAAEHIPVIEELRWRRVLIEPPLRPRFLDGDLAARRLDRARAGLDVHQLIRLSHAS